MTDPVDPNEILGARGPVDINVALARLEKKFPANKTAGTKERADARRTLSLELRRQGYSYRAIGRVTGVSGRTAWMDVKKETDRLAELRKEMAEDLVEIQTQILERNIEALQGGVEDGDVPSIEAVRRNSESLRKLYGLDKPTKIAQTDAEGNDIDYDPTKLTKDELLGRLDELHKVLSGSVPSS